MFVSAYSRPLLLVPPPLMTGECDIGTLVAVVVVLILVELAAAALEPP